MKSGRGYLPAGYQYRYGGNGVVDGVIIGGVVGTAYSRGFYEGVFYGNTPGGGYFYGYCVPKYIFNSTTDSIGDKDRLNTSVSTPSSSGSSYGDISSVSSDTASLYAPCSFDRTSTSSHNGSVCLSGNLCFVPSQGTEDTPAVGVCIPTDKCDPTAWDYESYYYSYDDSTTKDAHIMHSFLRLCLAFAALALILF